MRVLDTTRKDYFERTQYGKQTERAVCKRTTETVLKDVGLCVAIFDILEIQESFLLPGDGAAHTTVRFRVAVFRPFEDEVLTGKVKKCTSEGAKVTLGFFDDILIPPSNLQQPARYDEVEEAWIWEYETEDGKHDLFMDIGEPIRFRVLKNTFIETSPVEHSAKSQEAAKADESLPCPYTVTASISEPGLGLLSWWS
ncbi:Putative dna-directed rna polymerase subunit e [Gryllus bimaculatus]|nr:Putative dna-directed rna polymerase subunit e [Gryllus bimaculatus]